MLRYLIGYRSMGESGPFLLPSRHKLTHISVLFASGGTRFALMVAWTANTLGLCRLYQHWPQDVLLCRSVIKARQPAHCPYITAHTLLIVGCKLCHLISLNFILARLTDVTVNVFYFTLDVFMHTTSIQITVNFSEHFYLLFVSAFLLHLELFCR